MFFIVDDVLNWGKEDAVVEINETELVAVAVVEGVSVGVVAEDELVVMGEDCLKGETIVGAIDAEESGDGADDYLVDAVVSQ